MRRMRGVSICLVLSTGCALTYGGEKKTTRRPTPSQPRVQETTLPGSAALQPDGTVRFSLELAKLCQRDRGAIEELGVEQRKQFTGAGLALTGVTLALIPFSIFLFTQMETEEGGILSDDSIPLLLGGVLGIFTGGISAPFLLAFRYGEPAGWPKSRGYQKLEERVVSEGSEVVPCPDGAVAAGDLALVTPWGASTMAKPGPDGSAVFVVEWAAERASAVPPDQLGTGWRITTSTTKAVATWTPPAGDVTQIAQLITSARDRVVIGPTAAQLAPAIDAKTIEIGGTGQLLVTVKNTGGSTATAVTAKTRSSVVALHGLTVSFGTIQPAASVTRSIEVKVGADVVDDSATVLVTVTDGAGASVEVTKKLTLVRALCASGKLTRAKYDEKRAKLRKEVEAGRMTQEDFERFDRELLRCLE
jgi:hypothetical protein